MFSIIDIEATGGNAKQGKITEVAIYRHNGIEVVDRFSSLVNPEMKIPPYVQRLTGISNEIVAEAPSFAALTDSISSITQDTIMVAHNVKADYSFIKAEFEAVGKNFHKERLCTLQLSREMLPGMDSYSLGKLCRSLDIPLKGHHRADNDALATVLLFEKLWKLNPNKVLQFKRKP
ncbi:MAG: 3'-5' exonuclease [Vicingaceae bacterium]